MKISSLIALALVSAVLVSCGAKNDAMVGPEGDAMMMSGEAMEGAMMEGDAMVGGDAMMMSGEAMEGAMMEGDAMMVGEVPAPAPAPAPAN